jgi:hypothetical protein
VLLKKESFQSNKVILPSKLSGEYSLLLESIKVLVQKHSGIVILLYTGKQLDM